MVTTTSRDRSRAQGRVRWELLVGLVRKDLKVKYQGSVLGFLWSLANPLLLLVVYTFVFQVVLKSGIPQFGFYLLSGLLVWNMFAGAVGTSTAAVVGNVGAGEEGPLPAVGAAAVPGRLRARALRAAAVRAARGHGRDRQHRVRRAAAAAGRAGDRGRAAVHRRGVVPRRRAQRALPGHPARGRGRAHGRLLDQPDRLLGVAGEDTSSATSTGRYYLNPMAGVVVAMQRAIYAQNPMLPGGSHGAAPPTGTPSTWRSSASARSVSGRGAGARACGSTTGCRPTSPRSSEWAARSPSGRSGVGKSFRGTGRADPS